MTSMAFWLFINLILPIGALASGPPANMGHMLVQVQDREVLFDLQVPARVTYTLGLPRGRVFNFGKLDDDVALPLFQNSLGAANLRMMGASCTWGHHEAILAMGISRIRSVAVCPDSISNLSFEFPFLKNETPDFLIAGTSNIAGSEAFEMRPTTWSITLGPSSQWGLLAVLAGVLVLLATGVVFYFKKKVHKKSSRKGARS